MSLHLSGGQLRRIRELQELLVAPLRFPHAGAWAAAVQEAATDLFGVQRSLTVLPTDPDEVLVRGRGLRSGTLRVLERGLLGAGSEVNRYRDPELDRVMTRLAAAGVEVWDRRTAERISRVPLRDMPRFYREVVEPNRLEEMLVMAHSLRRGRAMLSLFGADEGGTSFGAGALEVFRLLLPAFRAGSRARATADRWRRGLLGGLELLAEGVAVYRNGEEVHRNRALRRILSEEEQAGKLRDAVAGAAADLSRTVEGPAASAETPRDGATDVTTAGNRYRVAASHLEGGAGAGPVTVLVAVRPAVPPLPEESELRERYGLTPREAEVAPLLARGRSNREIAERLGISPHTARHHAQRVLEKTGAPGRKALALHLLGDG